MLVARRAAREALRECLCVGPSVCRRYAGAGRGRTKTGRLWVYARDQRPWGGPAAPAAIFVFAPDRKSERPAAHLEQFAGVLHVDGYAGFERLHARGNVVLAACWAHTRRYFYEFFEANGSPVAAEALRRIGELYAIEARIRGQSPALQMAERRTFSKPLVEKLKVWLEQQLGRAPRRGKLADAIRYALSRWDGLTRFLHDGRIELGRVDDWRGGCRRRGLTVSDGFRPRRCRSSLHGSVSSRRSSNRACRFPAPGFLSFHQAFALGRSSRLRGMRKSPSVSCR